MIPRPQQAESAGWPNAMAGAISLLQIALGPDIAGEAFDVVMGQNTFMAACRRADAKAKRDDPKLERLRRLLDEDISMVAALSAIRERRPTAESTIEAIKQAVREGDADALEESSIQLKLQSCDQRSLAELDCWLLKLEVSQ